MWIFTPFGFFSAVQKPGDPELTIRARVRVDLDRLRDRYVPSLSATIVGAGSDYPYRAAVQHEDLARAMAAITRDISYSNFKSEVTRKDGHERSAVYHSVWDALLQLEHLEDPRS